MEFDPELPWYHGSPLFLTELREASTITQKRELARIFSHKPAIVSVSDDGQIKHNGVVSGYLYTVVNVHPDDVIPHPQTTMNPGDEWLTTRPFSLQFLCQTEPLSDEQLTDSEITELLKNDGNSGSKMQLPFSSFEP